MHYINGSGEYLGYFDGEAPDGGFTVPSPPSNASQIWTGSEWVETAARLEGWRNVAVITKTQFCLSMYRLGVLTPELAEEAAKGSWPAAFDDALAELSEEQRATFRISFAGEEEISRNHPALSLVQSFAAATEGLPSVTDEQLDTVFGWSD